MKKNFFIAIIIMATAIGCAPSAGLVSPTPVEPVYYNGKNFYSLDGEKEFFPKKNKHLKKVEKSGRGLYLLRGDFLIGKVSKEVILLQTDTKYMYLYEEDASGTLITRVFRKENFSPEDFSVPEKMYKKILSHPGVIFWVRVK